MKKLITIVSLIIFLGAGIAFAFEKNNTAEYIQERFEVYGYIADEADLDYWTQTNKNGIGNLEANLQTRISNHYKYVEEIPIITGNPFIDTDELIFGAIPRRPTEFKSNLAEQKTEGHSDTTLKVTSITTKDDNTLSADVLGDLIVLSINSGAGNSEVVVCTGLTVSTKTFTGCTFGYRFDDPTETQSGNIKAHAPGESVIISNTDTYLAQQYPTIDGDNVFLGTNTISTTTGGISFMQFFFGGKNVYIWADTSTPAIGWSTDGGTEFVFNDSGITFASNKSLFLTGGILGINTTTDSWFRIDDNAKFQMNTTTGSLMELWWSERLNATSTLDNFTIASTTLAGNTLFTGNSSTTGSFNFEGNVCRDGLCRTGFGFNATSTGEALPQIEAGSATTTVKSYTINAGDAVEGTIYHVIYGGQANAGQDFFIEPRFNNSPINGDSTCRVDGSGVFFLELFLTFGPGNNMSISGTCQTKHNAGTIFDMEDDAVWSEATSTVNYTAEAKNIELDIRSTAKNDADIFTINTYSVIRY